MLTLRKILLYNFPFILLLTFSIIYSVYTVNTKKTNYTGTETTFLVKIIDYKIDGNYLSITGSTEIKEQIKVNYYIETLEELNNLKNIVKFGNTLYIEGNLNLPKENSVPNQFNYKDYLKKSSIFYIITPTKIELLKENNNIFYKIKNEAYKKADKFKNSTYIYAYILGNTDKLLTEVNDSYSINGISHLFALSGLHVSIFSLIIIKILKALKISELKRYIISFIFLLFFSFITGFSPSILRATFLFFFLGVNKVFYFYIKTENILFLVGAILLLMKPNDLYNIGFELSYIATYFLIISNYLLKNKNIVLTYLYISIITFISSLPLIINLNNRVNIISILNNLFFVPLVTYIIFPLTLLTFIFPFLENILNIFTSLMETVSLFMTKFSLNIIIKDFKNIYIIIYYIILITSIKTKKLKFLILNIILVLVIKYSYIMDKNTYIYFLDIGQGDSAFIRTKNNKTIIIDTGGKEEYYTEQWKTKNKTFSLCLDTLIPFYNSLGINKIDLMFLSHGDADHSKEAKCLEENIDIKKTYINKDDINYYEELKTSNKLNEDYIELDNIKIYSLNNDLYDNENDNSLVLLIEINNYKFLFTGDISKKVEENIIKKYNLKNIDVLKISHHGSNTSTSESFIKETNPKHTIISAGLNNKFGHPTKETLETIKHTNILKTYENGTITFIIKENNMNIIKVKT